MEGCAKAFEPPIEGDKIKWNFDMKFWIVVTLVMIMWISIFGYIYYKIDIVTKDPCSICAEHVGEDVSCSYTKGDGRIIFLKTGEVDYNGAGRRIQTS